MNKFRSNFDPRSQNRARYNQKMPEVRHSVCALDCPDSCSLLINVEDGKGTHLRGDPAHPVTRGFLCGKVARYLDREYSPDRLLYPQKRIGAKGEGKFRADFVGRSAGYHRRAVAAGCRRVRPRSDSALQLRRHHGAAERRRHGSPLLPSAGRVAAGPHHLLRGRQARA